MPTYEFRCPQCSGDFERILRLSEYDIPQMCPTCGVQAQRVIASVRGFNLAGDNWPSKAGRIKDQMRKKNQRLSAKSNEKRVDQPGMTLAPNVEGERVGSWGEAQKLAASKGKDTSSYEPMVQKERSAP